MSSCPTSERNRWNERYRRRPPPPRAPSTLLTVSALPHLPPGGRVLDVAGGAGRHALWLAWLGYEVTLCDLSAVALDLARSRAERTGIRLQTLERDLERDPLPHPPLFGPWALVVSVDYLQRSLFPVFPAVMAPGGLLCFAQPTVRNLERHGQPSRRFLLEEGELASLVPDGLEVLHLSEGWTPDDRHEARLVARRPLEAP